MPSLATDNRDNQILRLFAIMAAIAQPVAPAAWAPPAQWTTYFEGLEAIYNVCIVGRRAIDQRPPRDGVKWYIQLVGNALNDTCNIVVADWQLPYLPDGLIWLALLEHGITAQPRTQVSTLAFVTRRAEALGSNRIIEVFFAQQPLQALATAAATVTTGPSIFDESDDD